MLGPQHSTFVMYDEEFKRISVVIDKLLREANAKVIFLVDKNGQLIAGCGETEHLDTTSLASLTAGNIAATGGLAKLMKRMGGMGAGGLEDHQVGAVADLVSAVDAAKDKKLGLELYRRGKSMKVEATPVKRPVHMTLHMQRTGPDAGLRGRIDENAAQIEARLGMTSGKPFDVSTVPEVQNAKASFENAKLNLERTERLFQRGIAAGKEVEDARAQRASAEAALEQASAAFDTAERERIEAEGRTLPLGEVLDRVLAAFA